MKNNTFLNDYFSKRKTLIIRAFFITIISIFFLSLIFTINKNNNFIAKLSIDGVIYERNDILEKIDKLDKDMSAQGLLLIINSPGGTFVSSKEIFDSIKNIGKRIPTAVYMKEMATSGGYLVSLGAEKIFSNQGTITGSIGVILQTADMSELLKKIGVNPVIVKSGELKSVPNPLEKINQNQIQYVEKIISLMQKEFLNILKDTRDISSEVIDLVSDGRILTGGQAKSMNLIDEIGSERDAIFWLKQRGNLEDDIPVVDISSKDDFLNILNIKSFKNNVNLKFLNGILAILSN
ncbi:MAG: putative signal peptide peptidase SppA [Alphaproteobacteria bacterium MarineAlpha8_Bin1]|nr:MAG: putative signal peptide peptidase SppA [Alphaproteobacteria bacterium MarineAlpha8_Bin1]|tara:strand:+ start:148 stop:1026 length:879 start_codon:yes stop_codon:yes gene_type:complete